MGKRKATRKPQAKVKVELDKAFDCLFCQHPASVTCKLDNKLKIGFLSCKICGQSFQGTLTNLSHPIDLYSDWIDAAEEAQKASRSGATTTTLKKQRPQSFGARGVEDEDEELEDEADEDEAMSRRRAMLEDDDEDLPEA